MPQLSPISWISVFVFLVGMMANMSIINWWYGSSDYEVWQVKVSTGVGYSRLFIWGKNFSKV
uniref:ATP synthase F0 subunit 8 n=1 Tax=Lamprotula gottschei TaxID=1470580 RepID=A0A1U8VC23_9BIVA|nr:ATP synthase F0 subunit 8 [Lamprotula gottschei]